MKTRAVLALVLVLASLAMVGCGYRHSVNVDLHNFERQMERLAGFDPMKGFDINIGRFNTNRYFSPSWYWKSLFGFSVVSIWRVLVVVLLGWLVYLLVPANVIKVSAAAQAEPLKAILYGLVAYLALVPATVVLAITILGIPLIPVMWFAVGVARLLGQVALGLLVGKAISAQLKNGWNETQSVLIGLAALGVLIAVPGAGGLVSLFCSLLGFGAVVWTQFGRHAVA